MNTVKLKRLYSLFNFTRKRMIEYLRKYLLLLIPVALCTTIATGSTLLLIPLSRQLPEVFSEPSMDKLVNLCLMVIAIYFIKGIFSYFQNYLTGYISIKTASDMRKSLYSKLLAHSPDIFSKKRIGELTTTLTDDINKIREYLFTFISEFLPSAVMIVFTIGYIFYLNWQLSLFALVMVPLIGGLIGFFNEKIKKRAENIQHRISDSYSLLYENFSNFTAIKIFNLEKLKAREFNVIEEHNRTENLEVIKLVSLLPSVIGVVQVTGISAIACYGGYQIISGKLLLADLLAFGTALSITVDPVIYLTKSLGIMNSSKASLTRFEELKNLLKTEPVLPRKNNYRILEKTGLSLSFENVSFSYGNEDVLKEISFKTGKSEIIAFTGDNGSGKSTLLKVMLRLYNNYTGLIKLGDYSIRDYNPSTFRKAVKACFHEPFLFHGSIRENILAGLYEDEASAEEMFSAAVRLTGVADFAESLPGKYEYNIGELGCNLSSGQKQRISLARAIISRPQVLILDEATSAMDLETEKRLYSSIRDFLPDTLIIVVNHRLSSIKDFADRFYLLKDGKIKESSTEEILEFQGTG